MTPFQQCALALIGAWLLIVLLLFQRSTTVLIGGLVTIGLLTLAAIVSGTAAPDQFGLVSTSSPIAILGWAAAWLCLMLAYSPLADALATRLIATPPSLAVFRALQQSQAKLALGILFAWLFGAFLEELAFRGIVLSAIENFLVPWIGKPVAAGAAICAAAAGAAIIHLYQGLRAAIIIMQLSILFGLLFVCSGHNLWTVILCHGVYDTIAFIRFAAGKSKYSKPTDTMAN